MPASPELLFLFSRLLSYPSAALGREARACSRLLATAGEHATQAFEPFVAFVEGTPLGRIEEVYTGTFDLNASSPPYVGYYLFGESYKRSVFLLALKDRYRAARIDPKTELPDHLALVLRWLSGTEDGAERTDVVCDALLPAIGRMLRKADEEDATDDERDKRDAPARPYQAVLHALQLALSTEVPAARVPGLAPVALPVLPDVSAACSPSGLADEEVPPCPSSSCSPSFRT